jgi:hypothetical protein
MTDEVLSLDDAAKLLFVTWADRLDEATALLEYDRLPPIDKAEWQRRAQNHHNDVAMLVAENDALRVRVTELEGELKTVLGSLRAHTMQCGTDRHPKISALIDRAEAVRSGGGNLAKTPIEKETT